MELTVASDLISPSQIHSSHSGLLNISWIDQTYPNLRGPAVFPRTSFLTYFRLHVLVCKNLPNHPKRKSPTLPALTSFPVSCFSVSSDTYHRQVNMHLPIVCSPNFRGRVFICSGKILVHGRPSIKICCMDRQ